RFRGAPLTAGSIAYRADGEPECTLAIAQRFVPNRGDGWSYVLERLDEICVELAAEAPSERLFLTPAGQAKTDELLRELTELGRVTGEMHAALGSQLDVPEFAPEPATAEDLDGWRKGLQAEAERAFLAAESRLDAFSPGLQQQLEQLLRWKTRLKAAATGALAGLQTAGMAKIQIHGDYHLGQVLKTDDSFAVLDFEGEPLRPVQVRRAKQSPARDAAGMLRSFDYAVITGLHRLRPAPGPSPAMRQWGAAYQRELGAAFIRGWEEALAGSGLIPDDRSAIERLLSFFQLWKALYELSYELNNRPSWVAVPLQGIARLL
ncbi:MAG: phosphotransferase, partial [Chloroflexota bacterium]|nr:phosphotransferase [Chloroflexota bacterium]